MALTPETIAGYSAIIVAVITGLFTWFLHRRNPQSSLNESFQLIVSQLQSERLMLQNANKDLIKEVVLQRETIKQLEDKISYLEKIIGQRGPGG